MYCQSLFCIRFHFIHSVKQKEFRQITKAILAIFAICYYIPFLQIMRLKYNMMLILVYTLFLSFGCFRCNCSYISTSVSKIHKAYNAIIWCGILHGLADIWYLILVLWYLMSRKLVVIWIRKKMMVITSKPLCCNMCKQCDNKWF